MANNSSRRSTIGHGGTALVEVEYVDDDGLKWLVLIPEDDKAHPERGIPVGPPDFRFLELSPDIHKRLHNGMYDRGLIRYSDIKGRGRDQVFAAVQAAYRVDVARVTEAYGRRPDND